jgi:Flp pilus assembly protein TadB
LALTFIAIVLLAAAWAALLLPDLRGRGGGSSRRTDSIANFSRQLSTIERTRPGQRPSARVVAFPQRGPAAQRASRQASSPLSPRSQMQARQRRRNVLLGIATVAALSLVAGVFVSPIFLVVHVLADIALGGFVWLLVEHRNRAYETRTSRELRTMPEATPMPRRRAAGS